MKKAFAIALSAITAISMVACGKTATNNSSSSAVSSSATSSTASSSSSSSASSATSSSSEASKASAKASKLPHSVIAGHHYLIGTGNRDSRYVLAAETADSGNVLFISTNVSQTKHTFGEMYKFAEDGGISDLAPAFTEANLTPVLSNWEYYDPVSGGKVTRQAYYGVPTRAQVESALSVAAKDEKLNLEGWFLELNDINAWTSENVDNSNAYYLGKIPSFESAPMSTSTNNLMAFYLNLDDVYINTDVSSHISGSISYAVPIDEDYFPDENFRNFLLNSKFCYDHKQPSASYARYPMLTKDTSQYNKAEDITSDGILTQGDILGIRCMDCSSEGISDLTGIEYFTDLETLYCSNNKLTTLDLSKNAALKELSCEDNALSTLDVSNLNLTSLSCIGNDFTELKFRAYYGGASGGVVTINGNGGTFRTWYDDFPTYYSFRTIIKPSEITYPGGTKAFAEWIITGNGIVNRKTVRTTDYYVLDYTSSTDNVTFTANWK